jgi:hypothetical protein
MTVPHRIFGLAVLALVAGPVFGEPPPGPVAPILSALPTTGGNEAEALPPECARGGFSKYKTEHYLVVHAVDEAWAADLGRALEWARGRFCRAMKEAGLPAADTGARLVWVCFPNHDDFNAYARSADHTDMAWLDEYYSARTNRVAMVCRRAPAGPRAEVPPVGAPGPVGPRAAAPLSAAADAAARGIDVTRATHEAVHQLSFNTGLMRRGVMYPLWVSEGMATNFEVDPSGDPDLRNTGRCGDLLDKKAKGKLVPLDRFVTCCRVPSGDPEAVDEIYAQAWGFFRFVFQGRREGLRKYLAALAAKEPGRRDEATLRREFTASFGPIESLEQPWATFLQTCALPNGNG